MNFEYRNNKQPKTKVSSGLRQVLDSLPNDHQVLDIGCGGGGQLESIERGMGIDISFINLYQCKRLGKPLCLADINLSLPFKDASWDIVLISHVIEHVSSPNQLCREAFRILKQGGKIIVGVPIEQSLMRMILHDDYFSDHHGHLYAFTPKGLSWLLRINGYTIQEVYFDVPLAGRIGQWFQSFLNGFIPKTVLSKLAANFWIVAKK